MAVKKKVVKKKAVKKAPKKRSKKSSSDVSIKIKNLDKVIKEGAKCSSEKKCSNSCGGFWMFGSALAMVLSYVQNSSIIWAMVHGLVSWFYVLYRAMIIWGWF